MHTDIRQISARIDANPLGRLMHGQRELFHSNLLAWFFDSLPDVADAVFKPLTRPAAGTPRRAERERQNMDLVLRWPDAAPLIIENKVFSLPDLLQLEEYAGRGKAWSGAAPSRCLLTLSDPTVEYRNGHRFTPNGWQVLGYDELAERIDDALPVAGTYEIETMRRYAALARDLHDLLQTVDVGTRKETVWLPPEALQSVSSAQMRAAIHKARAERVARLLRTALPGRHTVEYGMTRAMPLISWFEHVRAHDFDVHLGWQLQGAQFRRAVIFNDPDLRGASRAARERREQASRLHPEFFEFPADLMRSVGRQEFNHFAPDFVYRYARTPDLTLNELFAAAGAIRSTFASYEPLAGGPAGRNHVSALPAA